MGSTSECYTIISIRTIVAYHNYEKKQTFMPTKDRNKNNGKLHRVLNF